MKDKIILVCGNTLIGSAIIDRLKSIDFNDVEMVSADEAKFVPERGITINIKPHIINEPKENLILSKDYNKSIRKGGKKNKKNWRY